MDKCHICYDMYRATNRWISKSSLNIFICARDSESWFWVQQSLNRFVGKHGNLIKRLEPGLHNQKIVGSSISGPMCYVRWQDTLSNRFTQSPIKDYVTVYPSIKVGAHTEDLGIGNGLVETEMILVQRHHNQTLTIYIYLY